jgi:hypothetical protein
MVFQLKRLEHLMTEQKMAILIAHQRLIFKVPKQVEVLS